MRQIIFGVIGVLWGGALVVSRLLTEPAQGSDAYEAGGSAAVVFGLVLLLAGGFALRKGVRARGDRPAAPAVVVRPVTPAPQTSSTSIPPPGRRPGA